MECFWENGGWRRPGEEGRLQFLLWTSADYGDDDDGDGGVHPKSHKHFIPYMVFVRLYGIVFVIIVIMIIKSEGVNAQLKSKS